MCGRYEFSFNPSKVSKQIEDKAKASDLKYKTGEVFPGDDILCMIAREEKIDLIVLKWGIKKESLRINARIETIENNPAYYQNTFKPCAVIANGFYEWDKHHDKYYLKCKDEFIYLAAIYNVEGLLIITKAADETMQGIHERMPIIMDQKEMIRYVHDGKISDSSKQLFIDKTNESRLF